MNQNNDILQLMLKDFNQAHPTLDIVYQRKTKRSTIDTNIFPDPNLLLFLLIEICNFSRRTREEKMHWNVAFIYKNMNYAITHEKFGLRLYEEIDNTINQNEVLGKLNKILRFVEKNALNDIAKQKILEGNITIVNQFNKIDNQYKYFRNRAKTEFTPEENKVTNLGTKDISNFMKNAMDLINRESAAKQKGQYNTLAMIDAYFSRLEHLLVLALPFFNYDRNNENISVFVGLNWSDKLKRILDFSNVEIQKHYSALVLIKEKYRNTFAHGGFEKNGQSFYIDLGPYGAIPASLSGVKNSIHFKIFPIDQNVYVEICSIFDGFDQYLSSIAMPQVWIYALSSLHLSLSESYLKDMLEQSDDINDFEDWIDHMHDMNDRYYNADY